MRQARRSLALWLLPAFTVLVLFGCVVPGLPGAVQAQPSESSEQSKKRIAALNAAGDREWAARHYLNAAKSYRQAQSVAHSGGNLDSEARAWLSVCSCQLLLQSYRDATSSCGRSYELALQVGDKTWAGGAAGNLAVIYRSLGEYSLAEKQSKQALQLLEGSPRKDFQANALFYLTDLYLEQGRFNEGIAFSNRGIEIAKTDGRSDLEALLWDVRGFALLKEDRFTDAGKAFAQAETLSANGKDHSLLPVILGHRSELELRTGHYSEALRLNDLAFKAHNGEFPNAPAYYFFHVRGLILLALKRKREALAELRKSVDLANSWREAAVPGDNTSTQTVVYLNEVYQDFAQLAAELSVESHDKDLAVEALEALAQNRGASLREQLAASRLNDSRFTDHYFQLLTDLQTAQAKVTLGQRSPEDSAHLQSIRLELDELEDRWLSSSTKKMERSSTRNSLKDIQTKLDHSQVLLSFSVGGRASFLWAVTTEGVELFRLPKQSEIVTLSNRFREEVKSGRQDDTTCKALSQALFGQLGPGIWQKPNWLLTEDGIAAGQIPYAALADLSTSGKDPLIAHHNIRMLPSELLLLLPPSPKPQPRFVGVSDPIYNVADSRRVADLHFVSTGKLRPSTNLGRLAGSSQEVKSAANLSGVSRTEILSGNDANVNSLRRALQQPPEFLHFAVHVVSPEGEPQEAALALSLTADDIPQLLTREAVAAFRVPGSLVVLSGCDSGQGKALPSAGLIGLGRAWLLAGASAVIVSSWPVPDDSGAFFAAFYRHFQTTKASLLAQQAASALAQAQLDMQRSSGYRSSRSFWAAYSILSKE